MGCWLKDQIGWALAKILKAASRLWSLCLCRGLLRALQKLREGSLTALLGSWAAPHKFCFALQICQGRRTIDFWRIFRVSCSVERLHAASACQWGGAKTLNCHCSFHINTYDQFKTSVRILGQSTISWYLTCCVDCYLLLFWWKFFLERVSNFMIRWHSSP